MATVKVKGIVDLTILLDVTGSMQPCIDALRDNIKGFFEMLGEGDANNSAPVKDWRARVIGYRDVKHDKDDWYVDNPFTSDVDEIHAQLDDLEAGGGGDEPESLLDALHRCVNTPTMEKGSQEIDPNAMRSMGSARRAVIVFTDASFHPEMSYPGASGGTVQDVGHAIAGEKFLLVAYHPGGDGYDQLEATPKSLLHNFASAYPDDVEPQEALRRFTEDKSNFVKVLASLAKTVSMHADTEEL